MIGQGTPESMTAVVRQCGHCENEVQGSGSTANAPLTAQHNMSELGDSPVWHLPGSFLPPHGLVRERRVPSSCQTIAHTTPVHAATLVSQGPAACLAEFQAKHIQSIGTETTAHAAARWETATTSHATSCCCQLDVDAQTTNGFQP